MVLSTELPPGGISCPPGPPDVSEKYLQKVISTFVFGEVPSKETSEKVAYVKNALEDYYRSKAPVRKENSLSSTTEQVAIPHALTSIEGSTAICGGVESCDDADRSNLLQEVTSMLKGGIRKLKKEGSWGTRKSRPISYHEITGPFNVQHSSHVGFSKAGELEMQNLPLQLQNFVDNINDSLQKLGAANLTEEELKLLLATAPLPDLGDTDSNGTRSRSGSLDSVGSESSGYDGDISPRDHPTQQHDNGKDKVKKTKRKITHFISKKVSSFTNLLEVHKEEEEFEISTPTRFVKTGGFDFGGDSPSTLKLKLELAEKAKRDEEALRKEADEKLTSMEELAYKLRSDLESTQAHASTIKSLLSDANKRIDEHNRSRKLLESEMGMLRSKNVGSISKQQAAERALGEETKQRRVLEIRIAELQVSLKNSREKGEAHGKQQQEEITSVMAKLRHQMEKNEKDTETLKNSWCSERSKMLEEQEQLRKQIDLLRDVAERDKAYFSLERKQWLEDIEASKTEASAKVEEATKLLDAERKQHRTDKIRLEQLQETNETLVRAVAEANANAQAALPNLPREDSSNSVTTFVPLLAIPMSTPVPPPVPPPCVLPPPPPPRVAPLSLPLPTKPAEDHFSSLKENIQIGQARLVPPKKDIKKEAPKTNLDLLAYAIIARRQRIVEEDDEEEHNPDFD